MSNNESTQTNVDVSPITDRIIKWDDPLIKSPNSNIVIVSKKEWNDIMETLAILSDPETLSAIEEARNTPTSELEKMNWRDLLQ